MSQSQLARSLASREPGALVDYPLVARMRPALSEDHSAIEFEDALEELVNRIGLMISSKVP